MPKINSLEVVHQDTNKDSYQNLHDILVALNKSLALEKEVVDGDARASIENLLEMYVNDKEAFLRSLQTLTTQFNTSQAQFSEEILLLASQLEAQAKRTTMLTAQTENNIASVREYSEAVANEVASKPTIYTQDTIPTGSTFNYGDLWYDTNDSNRPYRWNGVAWIEITPTYRQSTAPIEANIGDIWMDSDDNNKVYRWDGTTWVLVDNGGATAYARWGVQVNANNHVAGIQLNSDSTGTSDFTVVAQNFNVIRPNGTMGLYWDGSQLVVKGDIYANTFYGSAIGSDNIIDGAVNTPEIASNAVSLTSSAVGSTVTPLSTSWTTLAQFTTSTPNATIQNLINCNGRVGLTSGDPASSYYECGIFAGSTLLFSTGEAPFLSAFFSFSYLHSTSTAQTYYLKIRTTTSLPSSAALGAMTRMGTKR